MAVIYIPKDTRMSDVFSGGMDAFLNVYRYADEKRRKEAATKLATIMELGGTFENPEEITKLETSLNLSPGTISGSAKPADTLMDALESTIAPKVRFPGRLERETSSRLNLARGEEALEEEFAPKKIGREAKKIETLTPFEIAKEKGMAGARGKVAIEVAKEMVPIEAEKTKKVGAAQTKVEIERKKQTIPLDIDLLKKQHEEELRYLLQSYKDDPAKKIQLEKLQIDINNYEEKTLKEISKTTAEIDKLKADAEESRAKAAIQPAIGEYYKSGGFLRETKAAEEKEGKVPKMEDVEKTLAAVGLGAFDPKTKKFIAMPYDPGDKKAEQAKKDLETMGFTVTEQDAPFSILSPFTRQKILQVSIPPSKAIKQKNGAAIGGPITTEIGNTENAVRKQLKDAGADDIYIEQYIKKAKELGKL